MNTSPVIDPFSLCWDTILTESAQFNGVFFNEKHCQILDSRDTNFSVVESRLAYTYKYGCINILFVEKCVSNFLIEPIAETVFPLENMRVCSLSNGPGLDIIGLLCALCKSNKGLRCFPILKAVNLYDSWLNLYKSIVHAAYKAISLKSNSEYFPISSDNVHLIQGDLFSSLSPEAKDCISGSNVIFMVKVFVSCKATPDVFAKSLKEIFSLLQPGSLIFFIGSKNNRKSFSKNSDLNCCVKCIYGPQKVTLEDVAISEHVSNLINVKPCDSGSAEFIVWQKRDFGVVSQEVTKSKRKRTRRKKKKISNSIKTKEETLHDDIILSEYEDNTDAESEISLTSSSKQSDTLSDELKSNSNDINVKSENSEKEEKLSQSGAVQSTDEINSVLDWPINNITSVLQQVNIQDSNYEEQKVGDIVHSISDNTCNLVTNTQIKYVTDILENKVKEWKSKERESECSQNAELKLMKESISADKINLNLTSTKTNSGNEIVLQTNFLPSVIENINHSETNSNTANKNSKKNKMQLQDKTKDIPSDLKTANKNKKSKKIVQKNVSSVSKSCDNLLKFEKSTVLPQGTNTEDLNGESRHDFQLLLQRCDNLVTSLEKLTTGIKNASSSNNDECCVSKCCYTSRKCDNIRVSHSLNTMHSCCCRKVGNCMMIHNNCASCCCSFLCRKIKKECECQSASDACKPVNLCKPYISIPIQNKDVVQILMSKKS